jgi:outer membrane protein TolC
MNPLRLAAFLLVCGALRAQPLSLEDCLKLALAAPSAVSIARQEQEIARQGVAQVRAGFLPQTHVVSGFIYNSPQRDDRSAVSFIPLNAVREYVGLATAAQEFDTSGRLRAEMARARAGQDAAGASFALAQRDLKRAVSTAYYRALLTRRLASAANDALAESESFERRTRLLVEAGESARADLVKASAQSAFLRQTLNAAELEARTAGMELASFWTRDVAPLPELADVFEQPVPEPEASRPAAGGGFLRRLEFNVLDAQKRGFQAEARREKAALYPQATLVFQYGIDAAAVRARERGYAAYINLNIPVFDWFKARSAERQFQFRAQQVDTGRAIAERVFSREYETALERVRQYHAQIALTRTQTELAAEDLKLSRVRYEGGEGPALDVVAAQNGLAQARANYYTSLANYMNARVDLEVASGR